MVRKVYLEGNDSLIPNKLLVKLKYCFYDTIYGVDCLNIKHSFSFNFDSDILEVDLLSFPHHDLICIYYVNDCHISTFFCVNCGRQNHWLKCSSWRCGDFFLNSPICLLPLATIIPLTVFSLLFVRNRWYSITLLYYSFLCILVYNGSNMLHRCSCFGSLETVLTPFVTNIFMPDFMDIWIME